MASTIKISDTANWASTFLGNISFAIGGANNEPATTSANLVMQTMLGAPFAWRWNRSVTGFYTTQGVQDYVLTTWASSTAFSVGTFIVDTNGNSQQVTTAGTSGGSPPTWNTSATGTTTDGTVTWTNIGAVNLGSTNVAIGWIESAAVQDTSLSPSKWFEISNKISLSMDSVQGRPAHISVHGDNGAGQYTFRLMPVPDRAYPVNITFQKKPTQIAVLSSYWAPIPDELSYIYSWGFMSLMYLYMDDTRFSAANAKFVSSLLSCQEGLDETQRNIFLSKWEEVTGQSVVNGLKLQQGRQGRAT